MMKGLSIKFMFIHRGRDVRDIFVSERLCFLSFHFSFLSFYFSFPLTSLGLPPDGRRVTQESTIFSFLFFVRFYSILFFFFLALLPKKCFRVATAISKFNCATCDCLGLQFCWSHVIRDLYLPKIQLCNMCVPHV